jgi:hypothetical protein
MSRLIMRLFSIPVVLLALGLAACGRRSADDNPKFDAASREAGRAAYGAARETGRAAKAAARKLGEAGREAHQGWKEAQRDAELKRREQRYEPRER